MVMGMMPLAAGCVLMHPFPASTGEPVDQPTEYVDEVGGFVFRSVTIARAGTGIPQHKHETDHVTLVCAGQGRLWVNKVWRGDFTAFSAVEVKAGDEHFWLALEPNTRFSCVFDAAKLEGVR